MYFPESSRVSFFNVMTVIFSLLVTLSLDISDFPNISHFTSNAYLLSIGHRIVTPTPWTIVNFVPMVIDGLYRPSTKRFSATDFLIDGGKASKDKQKEKDYTYFIIL